MPLDRQLRKISYRGKTRSYYVADIGTPRFSDIDRYGVVWNGCYINYFEQGRHELGQKLGFDLEGVRAAGFYFPVARMDINFKSPIFPKDRIEVAVRVERGGIGDSEFLFEHLLLVEGKVRATAKVRQYLTSAATGELVYHIPDSIRGILQPMAEAFTPLPQEVTQ